MEKSPHFKPDECALLLIDHQVGTTQLIKNITADQHQCHAARPPTKTHRPAIVSSSTNGRTEL